MCKPNNPCLNGGTCKDYLGSYDCMCQAGWTGEHCQGKHFSVYMNSEIIECAFFKARIPSGKWI